jgi:type II secretory pathway component PulJ
MTERDADIDFDFFDEPATQETTERVRTGGPQPPGPRRRVRPPTGFTPLLRLILLIALAIFVVVLLVFWIQGCREESRQSAYSDYMGETTELAQASQNVARDLNDLLTTPGIRQADLVAQVEGLTQRQEQIVRNAEDLDPPGPLRDEHENAVEAFQLRVSALSGLATALGSNTRNATTAGATLASQAERGVASDVIWDDLYKDPAKEELQQRGITGVAVPDSNFIQSPDLASQASMAELWERLRGAAQGGRPAGLHGTSLVSTVVEPSGQELSTDEETVVEATNDLAFVVSVQNSGENQEVGIDVTLTIQKSPEPIVETKKIDLINPGETKRVTFEDLGQPPFGPRTPVKVDVKPVPGEARVQNNSAEYAVVFSLPQ